MAIIVDKEQKRRDIALACKELFLQEGINKLTIAQIAKTAEVGKGTIYEYFSNKEEIVFSLVDILMQEHNEIKTARINAATNTKEKISLFFSFFYEENSAQLRTLYKEFISISLASPSEQMIEFHTHCFESYYSWFASLIDEGIQNGEFIAEAKELSRGLFAVSEGLFLSSEVTHSHCDLKEELEKFFTTLFRLIEVRS